MITQVNYFLFLTAIVSSYSEHLPDFRLPPNVVPHHYDLQIETHLEPDNFSFQGMVLIKVECLKPTNTIKIHASKNLKIKSGLGSVKLEGTSNLLHVADTYYEEKNEFFVVRTRETLAAGQHYSLSLSFKGQLQMDHDSEGYFRSSYYDAASNSYKWLAVTHFEPTYARKAFPCFDEPAMKATFTIQLAVQNQFVAVSNMPLKTVKPFEGRPGWVWYEFEPSVLMSTYLVAYMVSEFEAHQVEPQPHPSVKFRIWAPHSAASQTKYASHVGPRFLSYYENVFGVNYPLPKEDLVALPYLNIGGMENWGLVTFGGSLLLVDETVSEEDKQLDTDLIAHELAHMWFGNLVTMRWWNDLWLNEGFATYMACVCVQHEFPEWLSLDTSFMTSLRNVFKMDADESHPVSPDIGNAHEILLMFDDISYTKGSILVRMMNLFLGEEVFRKGITQYLKKHQFSNVDQDDLWASLDGQAHRYHALPPKLTVKAIMDTWTLQAGNPLITVSRNYKNHTVIFSQTRYLRKKSDKEEDYNGAWWVPLTYSTSKNPHFNQTQPQHWLPSGKTSIELDIPVDKGDWLILNNQAANLYRVNYDSTNWALIADTLNSIRYNEVHVMNRAQLIIDSVDLAEQGDLSYQMAFRILSCLRFEIESLLLWDAGLDKLEPLRRKLTRTRTYATFKKFVSSLMTPIISSIGKFTSRPNTYEGRKVLALLTPWACSLNVSGFATQASELFNMWQQSSSPVTDNPIQNSLREVVYTEGIRQGGVGAWNFLWERYKETGIEEDIIIPALTATTDSWLLNRYLNWTLEEDSGIRKDAAILVFMEIAKQDTGFNIAKRFFFNNFYRISEYFRDVFRPQDIIRKYFKILVRQIIYPKELEEMMEFAEKHDELGSEGASQARTMSQVNLDWMSKHYDHIASSLDQFQ